MLFLKFFNLSFGSDVRKSLFDLVDYSTALLIQDQIKDSILRHEPRVNNLIVSVRPDPDRNEFEATVNFNIIGLDIPPQEFTFLLEATR